MDQLLARVAAARTVPRRTVHFYLYRVCQPTLTARIMPLSAANYELRG